MSSHLSGSVIVITGASSGIGRATSLAFARKGAKVVLAARRIRALEEVADECRAAGGDALPVPTDTTQESEVLDLAAKTVKSFGGVDAWVNNAGVAVFGSVEDIPARVIRRVFETNVFGYFYGIQAVLPHFKEHKKGVIVNVASMVSKAGVAYMSPYVATKFALAGLADCVRQEILLEGDLDVHICNVMPASMDTPLFQHAANYSGRKVKPVRPIYDPADVAEAVVSCVEKPRREVYVGKTGPLTAFNRAMSPALHDLLASAVAPSQMEELPQPPTEGNLFEPKGLASIRGGWKKPASRAWKIAAAVTIPAALALTLRR